MKKLIIPLLALMLSAGCDRSGRQQRQQIDSLQRVIYTFKASQDSLQEALSGNGNGSSHIAESWSYPRFQRYGIPDPEAYVDSVLRSRPQLIPLKAALGGTMQFYKIQLINDRWIYAEYEDGHVSGSAIFQYRFNDDGSMQFKPVLQYAPFK